MVAHASERFAADHSFSVPFTSSSTAHIGFTEELILLAPTGVAPIAFPAQPVSSTADEPSTAATQNVSPTTMRALLPSYRNRTGGSAPISTTESTASSCL